MPTHDELMRRLEAFIDAKVAFSRMSAEQKRGVIPILDRKRDELAATLAKLEEKGND